MPPLRSVGLGEKIALNLTSDPAIQIGQQSCLKVACQSITECH
jgi:hypothetical protein